MNIRAVLKTASVLAIFPAIERSLATKIARTSVLQIANKRQINALAKDRPAASLPDLRPAWLLFINLSPMNIVAILDPKSPATTFKAVEALPENLRVVTNVTLPAIILHMNAFTALRTVDSVKEVGWSICAAA